MRKFVSGAVAFYMLDAGDRLTKNEVFHRYHPARFVIWPRGNKWDVREMGLRGWERITDQLFDTENEAFVFAYDKFCNEQDGARRK